ncbi:hypothetical protein Tco_0308073 [Tanacetum coccineum]
MTAPIISIPFNTLEESVGSSISRVVLFGMIPIVIPTNVSTIVPATIPSVIHDSAAKILIIPPRALEAGVIVVTFLARVIDFITYSSTDSDSSEDPSTPEHTPSAPATSLFLHSFDYSETSRDFADSGSLKRPPPLDLHETTIARWRSRVALRSSSSSSSTYALPSSVIASPAPCQIVPTPSGVPRRPAILVLPVQEIHFGRPYSTQPNWVLRMMTTRKRVHPFHARIPANRRRGSILYHHHLARGVGHHLVHYHLRVLLLIHRLLYMRDHHIQLPLIHHRTLSPVRADLLPPRKRIMGSSAALSTKDTIEESLEADTRAEAEIEIEGDDEVKDNANSSTRGTVEIRIDIGIESIVSDGLPGPIMVGRLKEYGRETFEISLDLCYKTPRGVGYGEGERADNAWRHLGYVQEELRQIHSSCYYDRMDFRRLETFAMRRLGYRP